MGGYGMACGTLCVAASGNYFSLHVDAAQIYASDQVNYYRRFAACLAA
jgi:hypothetical protein